MQTYFKPTETFQYTNFHSCHPPGVTKGFIKGEALRLLRTNSSQTTFEENIRNFATRLESRGYPTATLSEVKFSERKTSLTNRNKTAQKKILPFVTQYHPALPNLKKILMGKWHLIQNQPQLRNIFKEPPVLSYRKGKSLKDILVKAKLYRLNNLLLANCRSREARRHFLNTTSSSCRSMARFVRSFALSRQDNFITFLLNTLVTDRAPQVAKANRGGPGTIK